MATPGKFKLRMYRGDGRTFSVRVVDRDNDNAPVDVTGMPLRSTAKISEYDSDANAVFIKTLGAGITVIDPQEGEVTIDVDPADTSDLTTTTNLVMDLQGTDATSRPKTLAKGILTVELDVSITTP